MILRNADFVHKWQTNLLISMFQKASTYVLNLAPLVYTSQTG